MDTKQLIEDKIRHLDATQLSEVYQFVEQLTVPKNEPQLTSLMARLRRITIDGPEDFSTNIDSYLNGEKRVP